LTAVKVLGDWPKLADDAGPLWANLQSKSG